MSVRSKRNSPEKELSAKRRRRLLLPTSERHKAEQNNAVMKQTGFSETLLLYNNKSEVPKKRQDEAGLPLKQGPGTFLMQRANFPQNNNFLSVKSHNC